MTQYIFRRLLQMIPITLGILTLVFSLIHLIPGDPAIQIAGEGARPEDVVVVRKALGLDQPLWTQYVHYLTSVIRGDLGTCPVSHTPGSNSAASACSTKLPPRAWYCFFRFSAAVEAWPFTLRGQKKPRPT